tara:strand:+ start:849 stop:1457 length:609 start_codon:yes stop_codon:yes gene_type:complete
MNIIISLLISLFLFGLNPVASYAANETAVFAGGCFWCLEHDLENLSGVYAVESGYSGGDLVNPTYRNHKGHQESVRVYFNPERINYDTLLRSYWRNIDPLDGDGQFCDRGDSYRAVIFPNGNDQKLAAHKSLENVLKELDLPKNAIKVQIQPQKRFWLAEEYHQNFAELNSIKYNFYRYSCGRDNRLKKIWGEKASKPSSWS